MPDDVVARMNQAVDECLERCSNASTPPALTIEGYCRDLKDNGWDDADVELVRRVATRALVDRATSEEIR
jgi:hypothetical protein